MESAGYQLSPRVRLSPGDACRIAGKRGLFRFVRVYEHNEALYVDVIGPIGKAELLHTYSIDRLRSAGRVKREAVSMNPGLRELSRRAQSWRR